MSADLPAAVWPLALSGGYPDGLWTCAWCAAELAGSRIVHRDDCQWVSDFAESVAARAAAAERAKLVAELRNRAASERDEAITTRSLTAAARHIHAGAALDAAADLLADTPDGAETPGGAT